MQKTFLDKYSKYIALLFCILGYLFQSFEILDAYFDYDISTNLIIVPPQDQDPLRINICFEVQYLIHYDEFSSYNSSYDNRMNHDIFMKSTRDIFNYSYDWREFITSMSSDIELVNRFWTQDLICYQLEITKAIDDKLSDMIAYVTIDNHKHDPKLFLSSQNFTPWTELEYAMEIDHQTMKCMNMRGFITQVTNLHQPYNNCTDYIAEGIDNYRHCRAKCVYQSMKDKFNKNDIFDIYYDKGQSDTPITCTYCWNDTYLGDHYNEYWHRWELQNDKCKQHRCPRNDCFARWTHTKFDSTCDSDNEHIRNQSMSENDFWIQIDKSKTVSHIVSQLPRMEMIEIITFMLELLGFWFGICFYALHPYVVYDKYKHIILKTKPKIDLDIDKLRNAIKIKAKAKSELNHMKDTASKIKNEIDKNQT